jgi:hypothetical protein
VQPVPATGPSHYQDRPAPAWAEPQPGPPTGLAGGPPPAGSPRKSRGWKIAVVLLSVGLVLSIVAGVGGIIAVSAFYTEHASNLQRQLNAQKAAAKADRVAEDDLRKKFAEQKFEARYQKVKDASTKQKQALEAWDRAADGAPEKKAFTVWQGTIQTCMRTVSDYNAAARNYPPEWFSSAPAIILQATTDIECYSWQSQ